MSSGWTALILCLILGQRAGHGKEPMPPHVWCFAWLARACFGWAGSDLMRVPLLEPTASHPMRSRRHARHGHRRVRLGDGRDHKGHIPACWASARERRGPGRHHAGLRLRERHGRAMIIGVVGGVIPFLTVTYLKTALGYDDALDTFGVHAVGGTLGALLTGLLDRSERQSGLRRVKEWPGLVESHTLWKAAWLLALRLFFQCRHGDYRLHRQSAGWSASNSGRRVARGSISPITAKRATSSANHFESMRNF